MSKETKTQKPQEVPVYEYRVIEVESNALDSVFNELFERLEKQANG